MFFNPGCWKSLHLQACYSLLDDEKKASAVRCRRKSKFRIWRSFVRTRSWNCRTVHSGHLGIKGFILREVVLNWTTWWVCQDRPTYRRSRMMGGGFRSSTLHLVRRDDIRSTGKDISDFIKDNWVLNPNFWINSLKRLGNFGNGTIRLTICKIIHSLDWIKVFFGPLKFTKFMDHL